MSFSLLPSWLRWGIIAAFLGIVYLILIEVVCEAIPTDNLLSGCVVVFYFLGPIYPVMWIVWQLKFVLPFWKFSHAFLNLEIIIILFILGALLGAIIHLCRPQTKAL